MTPAALSQARGLEAWHVSCEISTVPDAKGRGLGVTDAPQPVGPRKQDYVGCTWVRSQGYNSPGAGWEPVMKLGDFN